MVKTCWDQRKWAGLSLFHESPGAGANWPGRGRTRVSNVCSCPFPLSILARIVPAVMMTSGVGILRAKSRKPQNLTLGNWGKTQGGDLLLVFLKDQGLNRSRTDAALKFCFPKRAEWWRKSWLRSALVGDSGDWMSPCFWILHLGGLRPLQGEFLKSNEDSRVAFSPPKSDLTAHSHSGTGQDSSKTSYFFKKSNILDHRCYELDHPQKCFMLEFRTEVIIQRKWSTCEMRQLLTPKKAKS